MLLNSNSYHPSSLSILAVAVGNCWETCQQEFYNRAYSNSCPHFEMYRRNIRLTTSTIKHPYLWGKRLLQWLLTPMTLFYLNGQRQKRFWMPVSGNWTRGEYWRPQVLLVGFLWLVAVRTGWRTRWAFGLFWRFFWGSDWAGSPTELSRTYFHREEAYMNQNICPFHSILSTLMGRGSPAFQQGLPGIEPWALCVQSRCTTTESLWPVPWRVYSAQPLIKISEGL